MKSTDPFKQKQKKKKKECEQLKKINPNRCVLVAFMLFFYAHIVFIDSHARTLIKLNSAPDSVGCFFLWRDSNTFVAAFSTVPNAHQSFASFKCCSLLFRHIGPKRFRLIQFAKTKCDT